MSNPAAADRARQSFDPNLGLPFTLADQLIPLFTTGSIDVPLARRMAIGALEAYRPESRADYVNAARTIAFSMAALALIGHAAAEDVPMTEKMRAFGRANALNRSADQSERTMMQRRRYQNANPPGEQPDASDPNPEAFVADPVLDAAEIEAAVAEAIGAYRARGTPDKTKTAPSEMTRTATKTATPQPTPVVSPVQPALGAPGTAIRYSGSRSDAGQHQAVSLKEGLLRHSAMSRVAEQSGARHPG